MIPRHDHQEGEDRLTGTAHPKPRLWVIIDKLGRKLSELEKTPAKRAGRTRRRKSDDETIAQSTA